MLRQCLSIGIKFRIRYDLSYPTFGARLGYDKVGYNRDINRIKLSHEKGMIKVDKISNVHNKKVIFFE